MLPPRYIYLVEPNLAAIVAGIKQAIQVKNYLPTIKLVMDIIIQPFYIRYLPRYVIQYLADYLSRYPV